MDGKCASRSNVYPYTSCCVLDIHFVLKNNFCVNLFDGNWFCFVFCSFSLDICTILFILCKKNKTTDAIYFLSDQENYLRMTDRLCVRVRPKSEWWGGVRRQSAGERAKPASLCLLLSLFFLGDRVWFRMYRYKKQVIVSLKKKKRETLERYLLPPSQPNVCQPFRRAACKRWAQQGSEVSLDPRVTVQVYLGVPATNRWLLFNLFLTFTFKCLLQHVCQWKRTTLLKMFKNNDVLKHL